ncbi:MAG: hypothetical protein K8S16_19490 [Bacteroidales bacterium]|nr:hypothetical protein [Bacteroidales bacterium]
MFKYFKRFKLNYTNGAILTTLIIYIVFNITNFNKSKIFYGDSLSYYAYLPALFIHNDVTLGFAKENPEKYDGKMFYLLKGPNDNYIIKASSGVAIVLSPFYLLAQAFALNSAYQANGFSIPYKVAIMLAMLVYITLGLILLGKILRRYFSDLTSGITVLIWFSTFQTRQKLNSAIHWIGMTKEAYWNTFLKLHPDGNFWRLLRYPDYLMARKGIYTVIDPSTKNPGQK